MSEWQEVDKAPQDASWVEGKLADGSTIKMHYASDMSGEDMPPFEGWFRKVSSYFAEVHPIAWRPLERS